MTPTTETDLAEAVAHAKGPLRIVSGGTRPLGRHVTGDVLSVAGLRGITLYEPGALTLVVRAGTPLAEVEAALAAENQRLAFEPMDLRPLLGTAGQPSIGGVVATNASGPRRVVIGAARDHMLGVRFVDGMGQVLKNGGRVMKNVTGYDLVKLMTGSYGTLGVLTEVSLKVLPRPETEGLVTLRGLSPRHAVEAMSMALGSPYEVTGAAHLTGGDPALTLLRIEGFEASVRYRLGQLRDRLAGFGAVTVEGPFAPAGHWEAVRDLTAWAGTPEDVWRLLVRPSDAAGILDRLPDPQRTLLDWGGGLIWAAVAPGTDLRARLGPINGHATLIRASAATRKAIAPFPPEPGPVAALSAGLRAKFDPRRILNPGLMG